MAITTSHLKPKYRCSHQQLYAIANSAWESYKNHLVSFSSLKSSYSGRTYDDAVRQLAIGAAVPDIETNNKVYEKLQAMLKDGTTIFKNHPENRKLFSFEALEQMFVPGETGMELTIVDEISHLPIENAEIFLQPGRRHVFSDGEGIVKIPLDEGEYGMRISAEGYTVHEEQKVGVYYGMRTTREIVMIRTP